MNKLLIRKTQSSIWNKLFKMSLTKISRSRSDNSHRNPVVNNMSTELEVNINYISQFVISKLIPIVGFSPYPINELLLMTAAVCGLKPDYIFEWGTHLGVSARVFYEINMNYNLNIKIHTIDLPNHIDRPEHIREQRGIKIKGLKEIHVHLGDGLDTALQIAGNLPEDKTLFFFIDGNHSYDSVKRELDGVGREQPNAYMLIHDTFYQSSDSGYNIDPNLAIRDFLQQNMNSYKVISTNIGLPGMTLLYNKPNNS